jgi:hypothetical protein
MHCSRYRESGQGVLTAPTVHSDLTLKRFGLEVLSLRFLTLCFMTIKIMTCIVIWFIVDICMTNWLRSQEMQSKWNFIEIKSSH